MINTARHLPTKEPEITSTDLVYGVNAGHLIFVERQLAEDLVLLRTGLATWGAARSELRPSRWDEMVELFGDYEKGMPSDDEAFDLEAIPGFADGDWPEWPAQLMLKLVPGSIVAKYGRKVDSVLNGEFLEFDAADEDIIVSEMKDAGFACSRDDGFVATASGL